MVESWWVNNDFRPRDGLQSSFLSRTDDRQLRSCSEDAELPFDNILYRLTASDPSVAGYVLEVLARCLQCGMEIAEKTLSTRRDIP
jgi:hypothetical protein